MIQQFRTVINPGTSQRFVLTNRDSIFAATVDWAIASMGRHVLKIPVWTPQANTFCERLIGTMRRECLDWLIPIHEGHLRWILRDWVIHYNRRRPHASLGLGISRSVVRTEPARVHRSSPPRTRSGDRDTDSGRAAP